MKTRSSYVSNSSSSSFIIYGTPAVTFDEVKQWLADGEEVFAVAENEGSSGDCADVVVKMTENRLDAIMEMHGGRKKLPFHFIKKIYVFKSEDDVSFPDSNSGCLFCFDRDYSSPKDDDDDEYGFSSWLEYRGDSRRNKKTKYLFGAIVTFEKALETVQNGGEAYAYADHSFFGRMARLRNVQEWDSFFESEDANDAVFMMSLREISNGEAIDFPKGEYFLIGKECIKWAKGSSLPNEGESK